MTSLRTIGVWRLLAVLAVAALVTAACSSSVSPETPAAPSPTAQGPSPTPTAPPPTAPPPATPEPTRTPDPTATPSPPTATPQPTAAAIPIEGRFMASVLTGGTGIQEAYTGPDLVFEVSGFQPLEMVSIVFNGPGLFFPQTVMARADTQGSRPLVPELSGRPDRAVDGGGRGRLGQSARPALCPGGSGAAGHPCQARGDGLQRLSHPGVEAALRRGHSRGYGGPHLAVLPGGLGHNFPVFGLRGGGAHRLLPAARHGFPAAGVGGWGSVGRLGLRGRGVSLQFSTVRHLP